MKSEKPIFGALVFVVFSGFFLVGIATHNTSLGAIGLLGVLIGMIFLVAYNDQWAQARLEKEKQVQQGQLLREQQERQDYLSKLVASGNHFADEVTQKIYQRFIITHCSKCNDDTFFVLQFNSLYTGIEIQCCTCEKKTWLKTDTKETPGLATEHYYKSYLEYSQHYALTGQSQYSIKSIILCARSAIPATDGRHSIPSNIKQAVWQRDGGKCVKCGSNENLEYDHIIPVSKGGSNTARNIQLLCEGHNRSKSDKIE